MAEPGKKALRAWRRLEALYTSVDRAIETGLHGADLPPALWRRALDMLAHSPDGTARPYEIQAALGEEQPAISRLLDRMVKAGLLDRAACEDDRRGWRVAITAPGRETLARMSDVRNTILAAHFFERLSDKQLKTLDEILGDCLPAAKGE